MNVVCIVIYGIIICCWHNCVSYHCLRSSPACVMPSSTLATTPAQPMNGGKWELVLYRQSATTTHTGLDCMREAWLDINITGTRMLVLVCIIKISSHGWYCSCFLWSVITMALQQCPVTSAQDTVTHSLGSSHCCARTLQSGARTLAHSALVVCSVISLVAEQSVSRVSVMMIMMIMMVW